MTNAPAPPEDPVVAFDEIHEDVPRGGVEGRLGPLTPPMGILS